MLANTVSIRLRVVVDLLLCAPALAQVPAYRRECERLAGVRIVDPEGVPGDGDPLARAEVEEVQLPGLATPLEQARQQLVAECGPDLWREEVRDVVISHLLHAVQAGESLSGLVEEERPALQVRHADEV